MGAYLIQNCFTALCGRYFYPIQIFSPYHLESLDSDFAKIHDFHHVNKYRIE